LLQQGFAVDTPSANFFLDQEFGGFAGGAEAIPGFHSHSRITIQDNSISAVNSAILRV